MIQIDATQSAMKLSHFPLTACALFVMSCSSDDSDSQGDGVKADFSSVTETLKTVEAAGFEKIQTVSGIFLAGQPDESGFQAAKVGGLKTVINLRHDGETELNEKQVVEDLGLNYVHLPWNGAEELTDKIFDEVRESLKSAEKPILLHCKSANRVGAVWLPFRVLDEGVGVEKAVEEAKIVGLKKAEYEAKARDYISRKSS